jgi:hypothetical protein
MDDLADQWALASSPSPLLLWILGSVVAYVLGNGILWLLEGTRLRRLLCDRWLKQIGRFLLHLGIPYLVLGGWPRRPYSGLLSLEDMGLVGLNEHWQVTRWLEAAGTGLGLGLFSLVILAVAWMHVGRARLRFRPKPWWALLVDGLYLEVHWAFYRGGLAVLLDDIYAGTFLGLAFVYLEWGLNPFWREGWRLPARAGERWLRAAMSLIVALLFLFTRNLWVCLGVHWLLELAFWWMGGERVQSADAQSPGGPC